MATVPLSGTNVTLLSGIPFASDYKNTRWFTSAANQQTYFNARTVVASLGDMNFQRAENEGRQFIAVPQSIDELWGTNYLMFQNASYNNKWFYAFVTRLEYVQRNRTNVWFEIDVMQTWMFDMTFKPSFVVREHCQLWNSDGSPVINTIDEGLYYGTEYDTVYDKHYDPTNYSNGWGGVFYLVIVTKSSLHQMTDPTTGTAKTGVMKGSINATPQSLFYYIHPFMMDGSQVNVSFDGGSTIETLDNVVDILSWIWASTNAVNNIVSMYITENPGVISSLDMTTTPYHVNVALSGYPFSGTAQMSAVDISGGSGSAYNSIYVSQLDYYANQEIDTGDKYQGFAKPTESKLYMYPYCVTILDDFKGNRVVLKNEYIDNTNLVVDVLGSLGTENKVAYVPRDYTTASITDYTERARIAQEHGLMNNNPQDLPILTDMLAAYLQGNRNSLRNQQNTLLFDGYMGIVGSAIGGLAAGASRSPLGVAEAVKGEVKGIGDNVLKLQGIEAKLKDISNIPPQIAKMGGNTAYGYGNNLTGFYVIKKQIKPEYQRKLSDFFMMFGYKVNEVKVPNFTTRQSFNYIQTSACNITGNFNNEDLQELKNVFDNGVTLWHTDDVGNYSLANGVV